MRLSRTHFQVVVTVLGAAMALVLLASFSGCNKPEAGGDVVATVNGKKILRSTLNKYYAEQTAGSPEMLSKEQTDSLKLNILHDMIENQILAQRAEKLGLLTTDEEVDTKINELKVPYTEEGFQQWLKKQNRTLDDLKQEIRENLTLEKLWNREITSKITVTDKDIEEYFNAHKSEFNVVEPQYHLAQILITTAPNQQVRNLKNDKAQNEADARKKAQMILNRLASGEDFATLAMNYSEDPSTSPNGGDMGIIPQSALKNSDDPTAAEAVLRLKPGDVAPPILVGNPRTKQLQGIRIIKLIAKEPAGQHDLSDPRVQQRIRQQLRGRREQLLRVAYIESARNDAKVQNYLADEILKGTK